MPVEHKGCSQKSEEEGQVLRQIFESLLTQHYSDREGNEHSFGLENILVVTPYNVQVNYLKSILPAGARVGTVDKFQGQEAEVVLISMVTSSAEDLPRDIEFLYSKNRLNVAISRARCLAVVIGQSPLAGNPLPDRRPDAPGQHPLPRRSICLRRKDSPKILFDS